MHCHTCPVRYYYGRHLPRSESDRYAVCKQVSYHLGASLDLQVIWDEVLAVRPVCDPSLREFLGHCISACREKNFPPAVQHDVRVQSEKFGIIGMVDRVWGDHRFSVVRAAGALPFGISSADRLRIAAYSLCLEEMTGNTVAGGWIDHIPDGVSRYHEVQPRDRRQLVAMLRRVRSIRTGDVPVRPLNAPCGRCPYRERCDTTGGHRLSDLL